MLHKTDSLPLSQTLLCLYEFIIKSSICYNRYQRWIKALMILCPFQLKLLYFKSRSHAKQWKSRSIVALGSYYQNSYVGSFSCCICYCSSWLRHGRFYFAIRQTSVLKGSIILFSIYVLLQLYQIISLSSSSLQNMENSHFILVLGFN